MAGQRSLLFVTPIRPALTGNGLAMRAGMFLEALARDHRVTLLIVPVAGTTPAPEGFAARHAERIVAIDLAGTLDPLWELCTRVTEPVARQRAFLDYPRPALCRYATSPCMQAIAASLARTDFDVIHVMRAYTVPYVAPLLLAARTSGARISLDLDDDELLAHGRFASLLERLGRSDEAALATAEASKYARLEMTWLDRFDRICVCTEAHAQRLADTCPGRHTDIVANYITLPRLMPRWPHRRRHILFVGNLSYLPNVLGLLDFVRHGLPRIRALMDHAVTLRIAGGSPAPEVTALAGQVGIELVADPPDLARHYRWADIAVVPVHAGGGTRIKLIEACAHGVPVVSTTLGAEGIPVLDGVHVRLADTHADFATACAELLADAGLARRLARQARTLVKANHARSLGLERIRSVIDPRPLIA